MSTLDLTSNGYPIFASRNYINNESRTYGTFSASEMNSILKRVIDGDRFSYWQGSTTDDTVTVTLTFSFQSKAALISRTFDLVCLQNINWKNFIGEYSTDGSTWTTITGMDYQSGVANNSLTDLIVNITAGITAKYVRFRIFKTITVNNAKLCGGISICNSVVQMANGFLNYKKVFSDRGNIRKQILGDGSARMEYILRSAASYEFYGASFDLPFVSQADRDSLRTIKRQGYPFVFIPEPKDIPADVFQCLFDGNWADEYENPVRSSGYAIAMKIMEVGRA